MGKRVISVWRSARHFYPNAKVKTHFPRIPRIAYEGAQSKNALSFKHYNPSEVVDGKTMKEHMRFSIAYWH